jgi:signal transduction histidine kinase
LVIAFFLYISFSILITFAVYTALLNNALTITSIGDTFFEQFRFEVKNKAYISEQIFNDVEQKFKKGIFNKASQIHEYIKREYSEKYDVAIISEKGVIFDTTNKDEINLDLSKLPDASKSLQDAKNTGKLLIDYPVLGSDNKSFYIYLLKYIPEKNVYFQLGYNISIFSEMIDSLRKVEVSANYRLELSAYHVYLDKDFTNVKLYGQDENLSREVIYNLFKDNKERLIIKDLNNVRLYKIVARNNSFALLYILHIKPISNNLIASWLGGNLLFLILVGIIYKKFISLIREKLENPIKQIKSHLNENKPYQYTGDIVELQELSETYESHLEKIQIRDFLKEVLSAQEKERERIARDVHDLIIQNLNYVLIMLKQKKEEELAEILRKQIQELREIIIDSDLVIFKNLGLEKYFETFIADCARKNPHIKFNLKIDSIRLDQFDKDNQIHLLSIFKELLNNAIKHSKCKSIDVKFYKKDNLLCIEVSDDGIGVNINTINQNGFGLISVKERVFILGGKINIQSNKSGTKIIIEVPIK